MAARLERRAITGDPDRMPPDWHPVLRRVYAARGIDGPADLSTALATLANPATLGGADAAAALLAEAVQGDQRVLFVGDFDADGATSCAVGLRALRAMGATNVDYLVPNRFEYGYGLSPEIVEVARERSPDIIVTVDNGISSLDGVAAARDAGIRVIVTDHHLPGPTLPSADAIVNPNCHGDPFPSKALAGVGVVFYVMAALRRRLAAADWFDANGMAPPNLAAFLDLVALGTVADVVPLDRTNRTLVQQGLARIRAGQGCPGIQALLDVSGRTAARVVASDLGFALGPRLNAAGRLDDMSVGIECLLSDDPAHARGLAERLDGLNRERREIEGRMKAEAVAHVDELVAKMGDDGVPPGLCLAHPDWHQGVIGIVASRVKERFHRPVIAFAPAGEEGRLKGSARSIPGLHMRDLLERIDTLNPGLIPRFGGHAMAAGLSLPEAHLERFREAFVETVKSWVSASDLDATVLTDGTLAPDELTLELAARLRNGGPWGQAFPEPVFEGTFAVRERRIVGGSHLKLRLSPVEGGPVVDAIAFGGADHGWDDLDGAVRAAYRLDVNAYRGRERLQLVVVHMEPA